ncbi:hypothetical protein MesoLj113a_34670 [Mesorhizobium sp. 113-1-2]|uniref:hypothetical protein n=1 Tax=Mesorhizobium sp. 113-1-2 TaxID=2744515 RepID=UPI000819A47F|nr:hypothetical protein [Mesorhizobium sp. 113-1-2]BAV46443.1 Uncharacterized protein MLTONO_1540 [Mesorhizobium loti]BCG72309.1 hypothetical protein MesoLj113a_34670 [Mesorhizobium sp. 113-1-2]
MQPDDQLQRLIDDCYAAFAPYPRPHAMHASPLRDPVALLKTLSSAPLRELTGEQIGPYAGYAMTTVGDLDDYKHFLPRILEQAVLERQWTGTEPPIIAERLKRGKWLEWPAHEPAAIRALFAGAWSRALQEDPDEEEADSWICGTACLDLDLEAMLEKWLAAPSISASLQLANFMQTGAKFVFENDTTERAFWGYVDEVKIHQMRRWLLGQPVHQLLLTARGRTPPSRLWLIDKGLEALASFGPARLH